MAIPKLNGKFNVRGTLYYLKDGKLHSTKGPAVVNKDKFIFKYYLNGAEYTKEEYDKHKKDVIFDDQINELIKQ